MIHPAREDPETVDVLVVGAGPAGLTLACDLARRGVSFRIVSAARGGFEGSRAKGVQPRTVEVLDDLGALPHLEPFSARYPKLGVHQTSGIVEKTMIEIHQATDDIPHPNTLLVAQYATDAALRARLSDAGTEVEFETRFEGFEHRPSGVLASLRGPDGPQDVGARFLVGADGGASTVRSTADIAFDGVTDESDRMMIADVTLTGLTREYWHLWSGEDGRFLALCPLPGSEQFQLMVKLSPGQEADLGRDAVQELVSRAAQDSDIDVLAVHWASVWRPNVRLAERFRQKSVFLVGDAAHVHPPTGAQGMNTGIQDAYNLGWKLGQVLAGASDELLDSYEGERQPVAARVLGLSSEIYASMSDYPLGGTTRGDEERQLRLTYAGGPLAHEATGHAVQTSLRPGDRAPDATIVGPDGTSMRLHDAFRGPHFTVVAIGEEAVDAAGSITWPEAGAELRLVTVSEPPAGLVASYGVTGPVLVLVRPDGYVGAVSDDGTAIVAAANVMLPDRD